MNADAGVLVGYLPCGCVGAAMLADAFSASEREREVRSWERDGLRVVLIPSPSPETRLGVCSSEHHQPRQKPTGNPSGQPGHADTAEGQPGGDTP